METVIAIVEILRRFGQKLGPYVLLEILLPGGSLFALLLFLYRHRSSGSGAWLRMATVPVSISRPVNRL